MLSKKSASPFLFPVGVGVAVVVTLFASSHPTAGLRLVPSNTSLPFGAEGLHALYDGADTIYIFGGFPTWDWSQLYTFSVSRQTMQRIGPWTRGESGGNVLDNQGRILYFGGWPPQSSVTADIWRVQAGAPDGSEEMVGRLPAPLGHIGAIWDAQNGVAVLFNGNGAMGYTDDVRVFSSHTGNVHVVAKLPHDALTLNHVVFDPASRRAYLFGGNVPGFVAIDDIVQFELDTGRVTSLEAKLPYPTMYGCAIWTGRGGGGEAYMIGGRRSIQGKDNGVVRFRPETGSVEDLPIQGMPPRLGSHACAYIPSMNRVYIFGGEPEDDEVEPVSDRIAYIDLD